MSLCSLSRLVWLVLPITPGSLVCLVVLVIPVSLISLANLIILASLSAQARLVVVVYLSILVCQKCLVGLSKLSCGSYPTVGTFRVSLVSAQMYNDLFLKKLDRAALASAGVGIYRGEDLILVEVVGR